MSAPRMVEGAEAEAEAVADFLTILEEHRRKCEHHGKYVEAEVAKKRLEELRLHEELRRKEAMRSRQIEELLGVEEAHMLEFEQFNTTWDRRMAEYEERAERLVEAMKERHAQELTELRDKLLARTPRPKFSRELLNLRRVQEHLAKARDYREAHETKRKADVLEACETERWREGKRAEMLQKEAQFKHQKTQELLALQKRIHTGREEEKKSRRVVLERLLRRYQNVKRELEGRQTLERIRFGRKGKFGGGSGGSGGGGGGGGGSGGSGGGGGGGGGGPAAPRAAARRKRNRRRAMRAAGRVCPDADA